MRPKRRWNSCDRRNRRRIGLLTRSISPRWDRTSPTELGPAPSRPRGPRCGGRAHRLCRRRLRTLGDLRAFGRCGPVPRAGGLGATARPPRPRVTIGSGGDAAQGAPEGSASQSTVLADDGLDGVNGRFAIQTGSLHGRPDHRSERRERFLVLPHVDDREAGAGAVTDVGETLALVDDGPSLGNDLLVLLHRVVWGTRTPPQWASSSPSDRHVRSQVVPRGSPLPPRRRSPQSRSRNNLRGPWGPRPIDGMLTPSGRR